jgi:cell division initiation protein
MNLTPRDIARQRFPRRLLGWAPEDVRVLLRELARALEDSRSRNAELQRRIAELEGPAPETPPLSPQPEARTAEISRAEAQSIIREAEEQAQQIVGAARAEFLRLGEQITILEAKQESVIRKLRQFLNAELDIIRTIELSRTPAGAPSPSGGTPHTASDIEEILRSLETP